jgi:hypothetical protein
MIYPNNPLLPVNIASINKSVLVHPRSRGVNDRDEHIEA